MLILSVFSLHLKKKKQAFRTPLQDYNVLLHLHKKMVVAPELSVTSLLTDVVHPHAVKRKHHLSHLPVVNFNAVEKYVGELEVREIQFIEGRRRRGA